MRAAAICAAALFVGLPAGAGAAWNQPVDAPVAGPTSRTGTPPDSPSQIVNLGGTPYVAQPEFNGSKWNVRVAKFDGANWVSVGSTPNATSESSNPRPSIAVIGNQAYVAWEGSNGSGVEHIWVSRWNGSGWEQVGAPLNSIPDAPHRPEITGVAGVPYVTWESECEAGDPCFDEKSPRQSVATYRFDGSAWQPVGGDVNGIIPVTDVTNYFAFWSNIADVNGVPYIAWADESQDKTTSAVRVYRLEGSAWQPVGGGPPSFPGYSYEPNITSVGGAPYVVAEDLISGSYGDGDVYGVFVQMFDGANWQPVGGQLSAGDSGTAVGPAITSLNGAPFVAWEQASGGRYSIWGSEFDGANWQKLAGPANGVNTNHDIRVSTAEIGGIPFVASNRDDGTNNLLRVERLEPDFTALPTPVTQTGATLSMQVKTYGLPYQMSLQYGKGGAFTASTPTTTTTADRTAINSTLAINQTVGSLTPQTAYTYRPVSTAGIDPAAVGANQTFATLAGTTSFRKVRIRLDSHGRVPVQLKCARTGAKCNGKLKLKATLRVPRKKSNTRAKPKKPRTHTYALGSKSFKLRSGKSGAVKVRIAKRWQRYVRGHGRMKMAAIATIPSLLGITGSQTKRTLTVLPARRRRR